MAIKAPSLTPQIKSLDIGLHKKKLRKLIEKQQALAKQLLNLMEELEDAEDSRRLDVAIKKSKGRPGISWEEAKKRLGLNFA